MTSSPMLLVISVVFACVAVRKCSADGILYKTPCCHHYNRIPDLYKKTPDFIEANGFIAETHQVTTEDGYILSLHRISGKQPEYTQNEVKRSFKPAVILQHGIGGTSDNWLLNGQKSFPIILAKAGYDVWLGDSRGNNYSKRHVELSVNDPRFWDFSFHEQGYYDLAAMTNYILRATGQQKIFFVGHSRGTTMAYVLLANRPEFNRKFHLIVSFAPVVFLKHSRSPVLRAVFERTNSEELKRIARNARALALPGINPRSTQFRQVFCGNGSATQALCLRLLFLVTGFDYELLNMTMIPVYATHYPDGGALKEYLHYIQIAKADKFRQYDYGAYTNMWLYGQQEPPEYDFNKITAPISLHYGSNDYFVSPEKNTIEVTFKSVAYCIIISELCLKLISGIRLYEKNNTDSYLSSLQIIRKYGYPAESHLTRTEDGYILELHRIPHGKNLTSPSLGPPIFIQHGVLGSSANFLLVGEGKALPFLLADKGYDVWLGNIRGNTYSRAHETLTPDDNQFWNFSWHESGLYDISAQIDFICNYTNQKELVYVAFSMGTTEFFVLTSSRPEYQQKIRGALLMAAIAYLNNTRTPLRYLAPLAGSAQFLTELLADGELIQQSLLYRYLVRFTCTITSIERHLCRNIVFLATGCDPAQFNETLLPSILYHAPAGTSTKTITHYAQLIQSGKFQQFDYGSEQNTIRYNSAEPPGYDLENIHVPIYIFEGVNDFLSTEKDVSRLVKRLPNVKNVTFVNYPRFNHLEFLFANDVKTLVYDQMIQVIDGLSNEERIEEDLSK